MAGRRAHQARPTGDGWAADGGDRRGRSGARARSSSPQEHHRPDLGAVAVIPAGAPPPRPGGRRPRPRRSTTAQTWGPSPSSPQEHHRPDLGAVAVGGPPTGPGPGGRSPLTDQVDASAHPPRRNRVRPMHPHAGLGSPSRRRAGPGYPAPPLPARPLPTAPASRARRPDRGAPGPGSPSPPLPARSPPIAPASRAPRPDRGDAAPPRCAQHRRPRPEGSGRGRRHGTRRGAAGIWPFSPSSGRVVSPSPPGPCPSSPSRTSGRTGWRARRRSCRSRRCRRGSSRPATGSSR